MRSDRDIKYDAFVRDDLENNRGRLVNCCDELSFLLSHPDEARIFEKHYLNEILSHATSHSQFYKKFNKCKSLSDFPIVDKQTLKDHWDEIVVNDYADLPDSCIKYTSGSTGTPFKMVMDRYKHCRWIAGNKVFRSNVGVPSHTKTVFISETVADKNIPQERMDRDNVYYIDCKYFDDEEFGKVLAYLRSNNVQTITALSSLLERFARYVISGKAPAWTGEFKAVFSVSETLKDFTRSTLAEYFHCPVYVLYANEENGVLAVEDGSGFGCRANTADFFLEVLSMNSDMPAKDGEIGRLVITDYFNKAFPVIRYENGDLVAKKTTPDGRVYITDIAGRRVDALYTTDGRLVHFFNAISFLEPLMDIKQFQIIQEDYFHFTWKLNTKNHSYEEMITSECRKLFGQDSLYSFEYVDDIPKLRSGKFRMTVCNIDL
ncbi:hypothetical protein [Paraeggerthella sp. Marseille-Q4926]|uniref:hypothetical protein n=1 Tax=Paraeggerthella sp. Marseille-Q4926 TaxID=2866587 RepID=UPI001CE3F889|nr:hypothetical protein [Paraeggerthella sp. Marseille-Q4926]